MTVKESQTGVKERIDVLDFIIKILQEHERSLDTLIGRLEMLCQEQELSIKREKYAPLSPHNITDSK